MPKKRIDTLLVERGLAPTRARAQALIMAGEVLVDDRPTVKAGALVAEGSDIRLRNPLPYVGRGGTKLAYALDCFKLDVAGFVVADIGASTGGFTDSLLQRGAARVYAVDVGRGQLDPGLARDSRVVLLEGLNARNPLPITEKVDLVTIDVSFISATRIIPNAAAILKPGGSIIVLIKPQFEALRAEVGKGGVIKDPQVHARVMGRFIAWAVGAAYRLRGLTTSPIAGASGNREFLALLTPAAPSTP